MEVNNTSSVYSILCHYLKMYNEHETEPDQIWKRLYFRTKDGRFQWFSVSLTIFYINFQIKSNKYSAIAPMSIQSRIFY
jgi:hypothetical protein